MLDPHPHSQIFVQLSQEIDNAETQQRDAAGVLVGLQDGEYPDENKILDTVCTVHWAVSYAMGLTLSREKHLKVCIHS